MPVFIILTMRVSADACRGQKRTSEPVETESQAVVSCMIQALGTELGSSARAVPAPNCFLFFKIIYLHFMNIGILPALMSIINCQIPWN